MIKKYTYKEAVQQAIDWSCCYTAETNLRQFSSWAEFRHKAYVSTQASYARWFTFEYVYTMLKANIDTEDGRKLYLFYQNYFEVAGDVPAMRKYVDEFEAMFCKEDENEDTASIQTDSNPVVSPLA